MGPSLPVPLWAFVFAAFIPGYPSPLRVRSYHHSWISSNVTSSRSLLCSSHWNQSLPPRKLLSHHSGSQHFLSWSTVICIFCLCLPVCPGGEILLMFTSSQAHSLGLEIWETSHLLRDVSLLAPSPLTQEACMEDLFWNLPLTPGFLQPLCFHQARWSSLPPLLSLLSSLHTAFPLSPSPF